MRNIDFHHRRTLDSSISKRDQGLGSPLSQPAVSSSRSRQLRNLVVRHRQFDRLSPILPWCPSSSRQSQMRNPAGFFRFHPSVLVKRIVTRIDDDVVTLEYVHL